MMETVMTAGAVRHAKLQSNCCHQQTNTQLFTGQIPFLSPSQQCQSTEGNDRQYVDKILHNVDKILQLLYFGTSFFGI